MIIKVNGHLQFRYRWNIVLAHFRYERWTQFRNTIYIATDKHEYPQTGKLLTMP